MAFIFTMEFKVDTYGLYAGGRFSRHHAVWMDAGSPGHSFISDLYGSDRRIVIGLLDSGC
jgi:hypothetical protein